MVVALLAAFLVGFTGIYLFGFWFLLPMVILMGVIVAFGLEDGS